MKNEKKVSELLNCDSVIFKSGNIVGWGDLNNNVGQTATEEVNFIFQSIFNKIFSPTRNFKNNLFLGLPHAVTFYTCEGFSSFDGENLSVPSDRNMPQFNN